MNKAELIAAVAQASGTTKSDAAKVFEAVTNTIARALKRGDTVTIVGFGTFSVRKRGARSGRNPQTGATIKIKASRSPAFKAGKAFKDAI